MKKRLDKYLQEKYPDFTRNKIQELIKNEKVLKNQTICTKNNTLISDNDEIEIIENTFYVSRAANKLKHALEFFAINVENKTCLDIGSSTGGFCQILLKKNVKKIYAIDVGFEQMNPILKNDEKIKLFEKTNFLNVGKEIFDEKIDFISCDVSFISSLKILNKILTLFENHLKMILLIKPQYETENDKIYKVASNLNYHQKVINNFKKFFEQNKIIFSDFIESPILGKSGCKEYLVYLEINYEK